MHHKYAFFVRFINLTYDIFVLNIALLIIFLKFGKITSISSLFIYSSTTLMWFNINFSWVAASFFGNVYSLRNLIYFKEGTKKSIKGFILMILLLVALDFFALSRSILSRDIILQFIILLGFFFWGARFLFYFLKKTFPL